MFSGIANPQRDRYSYISSQSNTGIQELCHFGQTKVKLQFTIAVRVCRISDFHHQSEALEEISALVYPTHALWYIYVFKFFLMLTRLQIVLILLSL